MPVLVSLFNTRLKILDATCPDQHRRGFPPGGVETCAPCSAGFLAIPFRSRKCGPQIAPAWDDDFWTLLTPDKTRLPASQGRRRCCASPPDVDVAAETFTHKVERLKLQILQATPVAAAAPVHRRRCEPAARHLQSLSVRCPGAALALSPGLSPTATPAQLTQIIRDLAAANEEPPRPPQRLLEDRPA